MPSIDPTDYQDLRLAVVMNGGVSLAVWIGGVAAEIHHIGKMSGRYAQLLKFTATSVQADVISGTSAGGINGAFLALARAYGTDISPLRDLWIHKGALEKLLRSAGESDPQSLLRGEYFYEELRRAFDLLTKGVLTGASANPLDLTLTTTLLNGDPNTLSDDFGTPIHDSNHRGTFNFRRDADSDDFASPEIIAEQLAIASRSTASFPIAFEPQFAKPIPETVQADGRSITSFRTSKFLLDGGILDNKPLDRAIEAVQRLRGSGGTRRVMCYIVPSPEMAIANNPDEEDDPPTVLQVGMASLAGIPMDQSISAQTEQIRAHNKRVTEVREARLSIASLGWQIVAQSAAQLFDSYRRQRVRALGRFIAEESSKGIAKKLANQERRPVGRRRKKWIADLFMNLFDDGESLPWIPRELPANGKHLDPDTWDWGLFSTENIANVVLDLLRQGINHSPISTAEGSVNGGTTRYLRTIFDEACMALAGLRKLRASGHLDLQERGKQLQFNRIEDIQWARNLASASSEQQKAYGEVARQFASLLEKAAPSLQVVVFAYSNQKREGEKEFASLVNLLLSDKGALLSSAMILERLLNLEVVQFAFGISGAVRDLTDQILELAEISADNSAGLVVGLSEQRKPVGAQLANFGGFYKHSWRAYDWVLGRLHGVERLLLILLDPERLVKLYGEQMDSVLEELEGIAVPSDGPDRDVCFDWWKQHADGIRKELEFLSSKSMLAPDQLPITVTGLLLRFQLSILREELSVLAIAVQLDIDERHAATTGRQFLNLVKLELGSSLGALSMANGEVIQTLWKNCQIGEETFAQEWSSDRFASTLFQSSVVGTLLLASENSGLGNVRKLFSLLQWPVRLAHLIAQSLLGESRSSVAVFAAIFAASLLVPLMALFTNARIPWAVLWAACGILILATTLLVYMPNFRRGFAPLAGLIAQSMRGGSNLGIPICTAVFAGCLTVALLTLFTNSQIPWAVQGAACGIFGMTILLILCMHRIRRRFPRDRSSKDGQSRSETR